VAQVTADGRGADQLLNLDRVTGVVRQVGGLTGFPNAGDGPTLILLLTPWLRAGDRKPIDRTLRIEIPAPEPEVARAMKTFESGSTVELELERLEEGPTAGRWAGVGRLPLRRVEPNPTLETFRQSIERPAMIADPKLGQLTLKPGAIIAEWNDQQAPDSFDGQIRLGGHSCEVSIEVTRGSRSNTRSARARDRKDIARAAVLIARFDKRFATIARALTREFLPVYNGEWRGNRAELTSNAFRAQLSPSSLLVGAGGSARLVMKTGNLFAGQVIRALFDNKGTLSKSFLAK
jgi:hypothetical protein